MKRVLVDGKSLHHAGGGWLVGRPAACCWFFAQALLPLSI